MCTKEFPVPKDNKEAPTNLDVERLRRKKPDNDTEGPWPLLPFPPGWGATN